MVDDTYKLVAVRDLVGGEMVDLEGDEYVTCGEDFCIECAHMEQYEYAIVDEPGDLETSDCMAVMFSNIGLWIGFPPDHKVKVVVDS